MYEMNLRQYAKPETVSNHKDDIRKNCIKHVIRSNQLWNYS
jgi:hypothetical protein